MITTVTLITTHTIAGTTIHREEHGRAVTGITIPTY